MKYTDQWWRKERPPEEWKVYEDFRVFLCLVWQHLTLPNPTPVQYDIARFLQHGPKRSIIEAFRGVGKSWITSAFVCWLLLRNPQLKIMAVSASKERADQFSTFTLRLISELPLLQHLSPRADQRQSKIAFDVAPALPDHAPSAKSVGIFGQLTGGRADVIIADDIEVPNNSETQGMRDKLAERVKEFDAVLKPGGRVIYLGTPQCEDSLYNQLPARGYEMRVWPARCPDLKEYRKIYGDSLAPFIAGAIEDGTLYTGVPLDSKRFNEEDLMEREASYGRSGFALQFMLDTRLSDADKYPLKLSDLVVMSCNNEVAQEKVIWSNGPEFVLKDLECVGLSGDRYYRPAVSLGDWTEYEGAILAIDPSGRGKDETSYAIVKQLHGFLYLLDAGGFSGGYDETVLMSLAELAKEYKVNEVIVESNFGDGMFTQLLTPFLAKAEYPCGIEEVRHNKQKELRIIDTLEPVMNQHRLIVDPRVIEKDRQSTKNLPPESALKYQLFYQMSRMTRQRGALAHDDRLDAVAIAVAYWTDQMAQNVDAKMKEKAEQEIQEALDMFTGKIPLSPDGFAMGLTAEQARNVHVNQAGKSAAERLLGGDL